MDIPVTEALRAICQEIVREARSDDEWAELESDDMFQGDSYVGGYDSTEGSFCFSYYSPGGEEYWFQMTLYEVGLIADGRELRLAGRRAN